MVSAFYDGDGGHQGELGVPLEVGDVGHAYVAHGGADLVEGGFHVVVEGAGVGDVGVYALSKQERDFGTSTYYVTFSLDISLFL